MSQSRIDYCQTPIFASHLACMRAAKTVESRLAFQADRSNLKWVKDEISLLFSQMGHEAVLRRLDLFRGKVVQAGKPQLSSSQLQHLDAFWRLSVCTAAERSWYMLHFVFTAPEMFSGILSSSEDESLDCLARVKQLAKLILGAEAAMNDAAHGDRVAAKL